jgi:hypothetical protein
MHNLSDEVLCARWIENPYYRVPRTLAGTPAMPLLGLGPDAYAFASGPPLSAIAWKRLLPADRLEYARVIVNLS